MLPWGARRLRFDTTLIIGAATSLRDHGDQLATTERADLLDTLVEEARRLERVVANLLSMTRVETGIEPSREWVPVEEVVGAALSRVEQLIGDPARPSWLLTEPGIGYRLRDAG